MVGYKRYIFFTKTILVSIFLVILAGSVVRTTQSGMGCPDWPHCFGLLVPPTSISGLPQDYQKYLNKQNIDTVYNPLHAWIEYVNRLLTGLLGILIAVHVVWSCVLFFKERQSIFWWSFSLLLLTALEAWIGKTVVDSNLAVVKITAHMLPALMIAVVPVIILNKLSGKEKVENAALKWICFGAIVLLLAQIILGTQVRSEVDTVSVFYNYAHRENWIKMLDKYFDIHQLLSFVVSIACLYAYFRSLNYAALHRSANLVLLFLIGVMMIGFVLAYANIPAFVQPLHLLFAGMLMIALVNLRLKLQ